LLVPTYLDDLGRRPRGGRALAGERQRDGATDAATGAGHQGDLAAQSPHRISQRHVRIAEVDFIE